MNDFCPCFSGKDYEKCCGNFIDGNKIPQTPEELMRSRYTAYTRANIDYIEKTMQGPAAQEFNKAEALQWAKEIRWEKLQIVYSDADEDRGWVEFIANYAHANKKYCIHETSEFQRQDGQWFYLDGKLHQDKTAGEKIGRNDPCTCGSQKKFKKCCGNK